MNATSSRAHTVVTITFDQIIKNDSGSETKKSSVMNLVDLAGKGDNWHKQYMIKVLCEFLLYLTTSCLCKHHLCIKLIFIFYKILTTFQVIVRLLQNICFIVKKRYCNERETARCRFGLQNVNVRSETQNQEFKVTVYVFDCS